jgi:hypothetical protein
VAVLEADTNGGEPGGEVLGSNMDLIQACSAPRERPDDLVYEHSSCKTSDRVDENQVLLLRSVYTHLRPTIFPWLLPTATSSPMITNLTRSALLG